MLEASGAAASTLARVRTLVTLEAMSARSRTAVQKIWQHTELSFKLPYVNVLVIQVVNLTRHQTVEHHLQPHQPKRSRVTNQSLVTQAPKYVSVVTEVCGRPGFLHLESSRICSWTDTH